MRMLTADGIKQSLILSQSLAHISTTFFIVLSIRVGVCSVCSLESGMFASQISDEENTMPLQAQEQETLNVKLVHLPSRTHLRSPCKPLFPLPMSREEKKSSPVKFPIRMACSSYFR